MGLLIFSTLNIYGPSIGLLIILNIKHVWTFHEPSHLLNFKPLWAFYGPSHLLNLYFLNTCICPGRCDEVGIDYFGDDVTDPMKTDSWNKCSDQCRQDSRCLYWTWITDDFSVSSSRKNCCLKRGKSGRKKLGGLISGSRMCGGPPTGDVLYVGQFRYLLQEIVILSLIYDFFSNGTYSWWIYRYTFLNKLCGNFEEVLKRIHFFVIC